MAKERDFEFELTHRVELTSRVILSAASEEEAEDLIQALIAGGNLGLDKIEVQCPGTWDVRSEETEAGLIEEIEE